MNDHSPIPCCMGMAAMDRCTCWEPVYDQLQVPPSPALQPPRPRTGCCGSCGAVDGLTDDLGIARSAETGTAFYCHQGFRRVLHEQHPDGRTRLTGEHDYQPGRAPAPHAHVPLKADGTCADLCAAWVKWTREQGSAPWLEAGEWPPDPRRGARAATTGPEK